MASRTLLEARHEERLGLIHGLCIACKRTAHSFSTCSSLAWCGTCKRLMSIETFRHSANYRQTLHRHRTTDRQHARCSHTTRGRYYCSSSIGISYRKYISSFLQPGEIPFPSTMLKRGRKLFFNSF